MDSRQQTHCIAELIASFPNASKLDPVQASIWRDTLAGLDYEATRSAIRLLRAEQDWMPTHHQLTGMAAAAIRRLPAPEEVPARCGLCDGSGWETRMTVANVEAVVRCRCYRPPPEEHGAKCSCRACYYGADRAKTIADGRDGMGRRHEPDPLRLPPDYSPRDDLG